MCCNQPSAPAAPDYTAAAKATAAGDLEAAKYATKANRPKQITPWGTSTWTQNPDGTWVQDVSLTPETQDALDSQQGIQAGMSRQALSMLPQVQSQTSTPFDISQVGERPDLGFGAVQDIQDAALSRLQPQMDRRRSLLENKLATQGITQGSEAWQNAQKDLSFAENDMWNQSLREAMSAYDTITSREMQGRQQDLQEQAWLRSLPINELNAVLRGNTVGQPTFSNFSTQSTTKGPDLLGAAGMQNQSALDVYNQKMASNDAMMSGLMSLGGSALGAGIYKWG